ncbi:MAG: DNA polymerase III subunit delta [Clostridia bacterium]|nr:DNA polymerase III subunit delta [Clostridia bacterium]
MPIINETELKKQIKEAFFCRVYMLYGSESYLKHHYYSLLLKKCVDPAFADFNLHIFDSPSDIKEAVLSAEALPVMSERTCIVLKDLKLSDLGDSGKKELLNLIADVPETCVLIICMLTADADGRGWKEIISACEKAGAVIRLEKMSARDLVRYVQKGAQARNCDMDSHAAEYFIGFTGDDMTNVLNELEKLCAYVGSGKISKEAIDSVTVKNTEVRVFELSKNLISGNCSKAFLILDQLIKQKEEPISILATLIMAYVDMYRAKVAAAAGKRAEDIMKVFNYGKSDFRLRNAAKNSSKAEASMLRKSLDILSSADEMLKSTSIDQRTILEETMIKLSLAANGE